MILAARSTPERGAASSIGGCDSRQDCEGGGRTGVFQLPGFAGRHLATSRNLRACPSRSGPALSSRPGSDRCCERGSQLLQQGRRLRSGEGDRVRRSSSTMGGRSFRSERFACSTSTILAGFPVQPSIRRRAGRAARARGILALDALPLTTKRSISLSVPLHPWPPSRTAIGALPDRPPLDCVADSAEELLAQIRQQFNRRGCQVIPVEGEEECPARFLAIDDPWSRACRARPSPRCERAPEKTAISRPVSGRVVPTGRPVLQGREWG